MTTAARSTGPLRPALNLDPATAEQPISRWARSPVSAAIGAFLGALIMLVLSGLGLWHSGATPTPMPALPLRS